jgi:hypothetical protein
LFTEPTICENESSALLNVDGVNLLLRLTLLNVNCVDFLLALLNIYSINLLLTLLDIDSINLLLGFALLNVDSIDLLLALLCRGRYEVSLCFA